MAVIWCPHFTWSSASKRTKVRFYVFLLRYNQYLDDAGNDDVDVVYFYDPNEDCIDEESDDVEHGSKILDEVLQSDNHDDSDDDKTWTMEVTATNWTTVSTATKAKKVTRPMRSVTTMRIK